MGVRAPQNNTPQRRYFEVFWYSHHLFIVFFILLLAHGGQCLVQKNVAVR